MLKTVLLLTLTIFAFPEPTAGVARTSPEPLAKAFLLALQAGDFTLLQRLTPSMPMWRQLASESDRNLSEKEFKAKIDKLVTAKLRKDFNNIVKEAKRKKIDLKKQAFLRAELREGESKENAPMGLEIFYSYNGKRGSFALSVKELDGSYYLLEILRSNQVLVH